MSGSINKVAPKPVEPGDGPAPKPFTPNATGKKDNTAKKVHLVAPNKLGNDPLSAKIRATASKPTKTAVEIPVKVALAAVLPIGDLTPAEKASGKILVAMGSAEGA